LHMSNLVGQYGQQSCAIRFCDQVGRQYNFRADHADNVGPVTATGHEKSDGVTHAETATDPFNVYQQVGVACDIQWHNTTPNASRSPLTH